MIRGATLPDFAYDGIPIYDKLFPQKLYLLLETEGDDIVGWVSTGKAFRIHSTERFESVIIPKYFKHTKLTSFQRQLNLYGFRRVMKGEDQGAYFHPKFQYGHGDAVSEIRRLPGNSSKSQQRHDNDVSSLYPLKSSSSSNSSSSASTRQSAKHHHFTHVYANRPSSSSSSSSLRYSSSAPASSSSFTPWSCGGSGRYGTRGAAKNSYKKYSEDNEESSAFENEEELFISAGAAAAQMNNKVQTNTFYPPAYSKKPSPAMVNFEAQLEAIRTARAAAPMYASSNGSGSGMSSLSKRLGFDANLPRRNQSICGVGSGGSSGSSGSSGDGGYNNYNNYGINDVGRYNGHVENEGGVLNMSPSNGQYDNQNLNMLYHSFNGNNPSLQGANLMAGGGYTEMGPPMKRRNVSSNENNSKVFNDGLNDNQGPYIYNGYKTDSVMSLPELDKWNTNIYSSALIDQVGVPSEKQLAATAGTGDFDFLFDNLEFDEVANTSQDDTTPAIATDTQVEPPPRSVDSKSPVDIKSGDDSSIKSVAILIEAAPPTVDTKKSSLVSAETTVADGAN